LISDKPSHFGGYRLARTLAQGALVSITLLLPLSTTTPALAQETPATKSLTDMSIEELMSLRIEYVYGASGFKQKVTEAPASVTIVSSEDIQKFGYRTLADILRNVPGFSSPTTETIATWECAVLDCPDNTTTASPC